MNSVESLLMLKYKKNNMKFIVAEKEGVVGTYTSNEVNKEEAWKEVRSKFPDAAFIEEQHLVYFCSGHRDITDQEFKDTYAVELDKILEEDPDSEFVVGDYQGADIMVQKYLAKNIKDPSKVTVYHMFDAPRNLASNEFKLQGGFKTDEERDAAMTYNSDKDVAFLRSGKRDSGTAQNIIRRFEVL